MRSLALIASARVIRPAARGLFIAAILLGGTLAQAGAEVDRTTLDESTVVAGKRLRLNGAGIGMRFVFNVYAIGLYLADRKLQASEVLSTKESRRLAIVLLRDVSSQDFIEAVNGEASARGNRTETAVGHHMQSLTDAIAVRPQGLRKGDRLTLDWIPSSGATIELNGTPLLGPVPSAEFYNALLEIWLGDRPMDPALKRKLLGAGL